MRNKVYLLLAVLCVASLTNAMNDLVTIQTEDTQFVLLKKFVNESAVLMKGIDQMEQKGFVTSVDMTFAQFNPMVPYLKIGCDITRLQQAMESMPEGSGRQQQKRNIVQAKLKLAKAIAGYSQSKWKKCMTVSKALQINSVLSVATVVGKKKKWLKK